MVKATDTNYFSLLCCRLATHIVDTPPHLAPLMTVSLDPRMEREPENTTVSVYQNSLKNDHRSSGVTEGSLGLSG